MNRLQHPLKLVLSAQQKNSSLIQKLSRQFVTGNNNNNNNNNSDNSQSQNTKNSSSPFVSRDLKSYRDANPLYHKNVRQTQSGESAYDNFRNPKKHQANGEKSTPQFALNQNDNLKSKSQRDGDFATFCRLCDERRLDSEEFQVIKPRIIEMIQEQKYCRTLLKFHKQLQKTHYFDKEVFTALIEQTVKLSSSFEALDLISMISTCSTFVPRYVHCDPEHRDFIKHLMETTLRSFTKADANVYRYIEFGFNSLAKVPLQDYSLYDYLFSRFEQNMDSYTHYQFVSLIDRIYHLTMVYNRMETQRSLNKQIKSRLKDFMMKPKVVERIATITNAELELDEETLKLKYGVDKERIPLTISKLASLLSRQFKRFAHEGKSSLYSEEGEDAPELDIFTDEVANVYDVAWKQIEKFTLKNYKLLDDRSLKAVLMSMNGTRQGSEEFYNVLLEEFYQRITSKPLDKQNNNFYCAILRSFYSSRVQPRNLEKYEQEFVKITKQKYLTFSSENKMTIITSYSTIGDAETIKYMMENITVDEIKQLNKMGQTLLFWALCNIGYFDQKFFKEFLLHTADPTDPFFVQNPYTMVQVTQILQIIKLKQKDFWKEHKEDFDFKLEQFKELTYMYHTMFIQLSSQYRKKTIGSFDMADLLHAMGIEFYFEPIVDKIFNVDFVLKGMTEAKLEELVRRKSAITTQFRDFTFKQYLEIKKFDQQNDSINKKSDILLEIDGVTHFVSKSKKRQSTNCKAEILQELGYKVLQIDTFELQKLAQLSDKNLVVEKFIDYLSNLIIAKKRPRISKAKTEKSADKKEEKTNEENQTIS